MGAHIKDQQSYGHRTNPMGILTEDQSYGDMHKGPILWGHVQRINPMGTRKKDQSNRNMYKGPILWGHI